jgi:tetratricopeptide (TPR) repeat protein
MPDETPVPPDFRSLREIIGGDGIAAAQFRKIALDLATSLAEHHEQGVMHGFLAPESVVVTPQGEAQILGFGMAAPPEVFDPHPDLLALGRILYELATGHPATPAADAAPDTPSVTPDLERLPADLRPLIWRALSGSYASARDLAADIYALHTPGPAMPAHAHEPRKYLWVVAALVLVAALGMWWRRARSGGGRASRHAVTVVWVSNQAQDRSLEWLSRGIPDLLTTGLEQIEGLEVISLDRQLEALGRGQAVNQLANPSVALELARDAGADLSVSGALLRDGPSRLRLELRIQDTAGGRLRSEFKIYADNSSDIVRMLDAAVKNVAGAVLDSSHPVTKWPAMAQIASANAAALHHYVNGEEADTKHAVEEFTEALRLDPDFALAQFRLAELFCRGGGPRQCYELLNKTRAQESRLPRRERLRLPLDLAALSGDSATQRRSLEKLLAAFPRDTSTRNELGLLLSLSSDPSAAVQVVKQGLELDPEDASLLNQMVYATAMAGDNAAWRKASDRYIEVHPSDNNALDTRGETLYILGNDEEALSTFRKLLEKEPDFGGYSSYQKIALIMADQGVYEDAAAALNDYEAHLPAEEQHLAPLYQARLAEAMGDTGAAMEGYLRGADWLGTNGRTSAAGDVLMSLANVAILSATEKDPAPGFANITHALSMVKSLKLLGEELPAQAWLQAAIRDEVGAQLSLQQYFALHPWIGVPEKDRLTLMIRAYSALLRKDTAGAAQILKDLPYDGAPWMLYARGLAGDQQSMRRALVNGRALFLPSPLEWPSPYRQRLIRERLGMKEPVEKPGKSGTVHL